MFKLFGPNYKAINRLQATIEQNEQLVEELLILQENALYPAEKEDLGSAITALEQQNTLLFSRSSFPRVTTDSLVGFSVSSPSLLPPTAAFNIYILTS